jgi:proteasome accessory factor B
MSSLDSRIERIEDIERKLSRRPDGWTTGELAREYGVDPSTIFRDLATLETWGTGLIKRGRRYILDHRRSLHQVRLTNDEVLALYLAARLLSRHSDEHNPHVVKALEKLADALRTKSPLIAQHVDLAAKAVRARPVRLAYIEALEALTQGWAEGRKVWVRYRNAKGVVSERTFAPYFIEPSGIGYACHVIGWDDLKGQTITLKIERITEARVTDERFTYTTFDPQQVLSNAWGVIWRDEGAIEVKLRFSPAVAQRLKESTWHHSQRIEDSPDGSCVLSVQVGSTLEMKPWIRGWGKDVVVLTPAELREEIVAEVREMARAYGVCEGEGRQNDGI